MCVTLLTLPLILKPPPLSKELVSSEPLQIPEGIRWKRIKLASSGISLNTILLGNPEKEMVLLLHGFPESGLVTWHKQLKYFSKHLDSFFLVVPDLRGYNTSDKPDGVSSYKISLLTQDMVDLLDHFLKEKCIVVGHDWGGIVAYNLALRRPERVKKLVAINVPHPTAMQDQLMGKKLCLEQVKRSWYILFFQIPYVSEYFLLGVLPNGILSSAKPQAFSRAELELLSQSLGSMSSLTSIVNYYRATLLYREPLPDIIVHVPTLILWGEKDEALNPTLPHASAEFIDNVKLEIFPDNTHWIIHESPTTVSEKLHSFFIEP
jgi:pimeloyl-ACP methyl ester carboxylesterase